MNPGAGEPMLGEEFLELLHALGTGDVVPDSPDEEQADEDAQQQQREIAEALRGVQEQKFPHGP